MLRKILFALALLIAFCPLKSAATTLDSNDYYGFYISPSYLMYPQPRYCIGFQYIRPNRSFNFDVGFGNKSLAGIIDLNDIYQLFELRPEWKWYLNPPRKNRLYLSVELSYMKVKNIQYKDYIFHENSNQIEKYYKADVIDKNYSLMYKTGRELWIRNKVQIDFYLGVGFTLQNRAFTNVIRNTILSAQNYSTSIWTNTGNYQGYNLSIRSVIGLRIGLVFKRNYSFEFSIDS